MGEMTLEAVVAWLLDNEYMRVANGQLVITKKFNQEALRQDVKPTKKESKSVPIDLEKTWRQFVEDAKIPSRASPGGYWLRLYHASSAAELVKVLRKVQYKKFVEATEYYYRSTSHPTTLLKYLREGIWEEIYNDYVAGRQMNTQGENPFEK